VDSSIFLGGSVIAATVAGVIALFAPCCISVMLPAYFASSFQNRRLLVAMTFLFAGGVATVILPLAMGASALRQLITEQHAPVYVTGGLLMLGLGAYTLLGGQLHLPMPGRKAGGKGGPVSVYSLGVFSGVASSCCAPVLAGVIALSGVASSFGAALGLGSAYVFGMVAPLFAISVLWERYDFRESRLFRPRSFSYRIGPLRRTVTGTNLASGLLLAGMGLVTVYVGFAYNAMPASSGWQASLSVWLQDHGRQITDALSWVPSWAAAAGLLALVALLALRALRQVGDEEPEAEGASTEDPQTKETAGER
jgi:cytochrome c biogenesis protein CcdA